MQIDELQAGQAHSHGIDREIATSEITGERLAERHLGLARVRVVGLGSIRRDLEVMVTLAGTHRAEAHAHVPDVIGPSPRQLLDALRTGIGGQIEVMRDPGSPEHDVANRAAHEGQLVPGFGESRREGSKGVGDPQEGGRG